MDMDTNQDFDLEDILKEFSEHPEAEEPAQSAGQMPELRFDEEPSEAPEVKEPEAQEPEEPARPDTQEFTPVEEPASDAITTESLLPMPRPPMNPPSSWICRRSRKPRSRRLPSLPLR